MERQGTSDRVQGSCSCAYRESTCTTIETWVFNFALRLIVLSSYARVFHMRGSLGLKCEHVVFIVGTWSIFADSRLSHAHTVSFTVTRLFRVWKQARISAWMAATQSLS